MSYRIFDGAPRSATATATKPTTLVRLERDDFINFVKTNPSASISIMAELGERLRHTNELIAKATDDLQRVGGITSSWSVHVAHLYFLLLVDALLFGAWKLILILRRVPLSNWKEIFAASSLTLGRVLTAAAIGTLWAVPAGLAIGLSPRLSRILQPVVQIIASFPAPMLYPIVIAGLHIFGVPLGWGFVWRRCYTFAEKRFSLTK